MTNEQNKPFEEMLKHWEDMGWITVNPNLRRDSLVVHIKTAIQNMSVRAFFDFLRDILP